MTLEEYKIEEIEKVYYKWIGGFNSASSCMSEISNILKTKQYKDVKVYIDGNQIGTAKQVFMR